LQISVLLYSPVGEYNSLIRQIWPINLYRSCYIHLCKNTKLFIESNFILVRGQQFPDNSQYQYLFCIIDIHPDCLL
jgi:hypothetical protein